VPAPKLEAEPEGVPKLKQESEPEVTKEVVKAPPGPTSFHSLEKVLVVDLVPPMAAPLPEQGLAEPPPATAAAPALALATAIVDDDEEIIIPGVGRRRAGHARRSTRWGLRSLLLLVVMVAGFAVAHQYRKMPGIDDGIDQAWLRAKGVGKP
jgi:hypothetical protein